MSEYFHWTSILLLPSFPTCCPACCYILEPSVRTHNSLRSVRVQMGLPFLIFSVSQKGPKSSPLFEIKRLPCSSATSGANLEALLSLSSEIRRLWYPTLRRITDLRWPSPRLSIAVLFFLLLFHRLSRTSNITRLGEDNQQPCLCWLCSHSHLLRHFYRGMP